MKLLIILLLIIFYKSITKAFEGLEFKQLPKNKKCSRDLVISSKEQCQAAIDKLGLTTAKWWEGYDTNVPPGCSWTDKVSHVNNSLGFWNKSSTGNKRYDLHPICNNPPPEIITSEKMLKKINNNLDEASLEKRGDVPIALNVNVQKEGKIF